eukprot:1135880-Amphidinium_carterae.1
MCQDYAAQPKRLKDFENSARRSPRQLALCFPGQPGLFPDDLQLPLQVRPEGYFAQPKVGPATEPHFQARPEAAEHFNFLLDRP